MEPVSVKISGTSALLLVRLAEQLGATTDGDVGAIVMRALGLLDLALRAKAGGKRLAFVDPATGQTSEVAF